MDFEDIANALWVGVIIVVAVLSGKGKRISIPNRKSKPSDKPDADKVRKLIEATRRAIKTTQHPCNTDAQTSPSHTSQSDVPLSPAKRNFSAYKHLPEQTTTEGNIPDVAVLLTETKASVVCKPVSSVQKEITGKKTKLREWITGQVILDVPAFRKNYGNFFNR